MSSRIGLASGSTMPYDSGWSTGPASCALVSLTDEVLDDGGVVDERIGVTCFEEAHRRLRVGDGVCNDPCVAEEVVGGGPPDGDDVATVEIRHGLDVALEPLQRELGGDLGGQRGHEQDAAEHPEHADQARRGPPRYCVAVPDREQRDTGPPHAMEGPVTFLVSKSGFR